MRQDAYLAEIKCKSDDVKRIKRNLEFNTWINLNKAAVTLQKNFRGFIEKDYLLRLLEYKYCKDMEEPSLRL